jgi:hypothetical protein
MLPIEMPRTAKDRERKQRSAPAQSKASTRDRRNGTVTVSLRIPSGMLTEIDGALKSRPYKMPRHMWLLEAIHEKLMRARQPASDAAFTAEGIVR